MKFLLAWNIINRTLSFRWYKSCTFFLVIFNFKYLHAYIFSMWVMFCTKSRFLFKRWHLIGKSIFGPFCVVAVTSWFDKAIMCKVVLIKSFVGLFLWIKISDLGWFWPVGENFQIWINVKFLLTMEVGFFFLIKRLQLCLNSSV